MKQQEPWLHQFIFQQLTNIQNLAILLVLTIHELKIQHAQQRKKTLAAIEKADYAIATSSGMSAIVLAFEIFPVGSKVVAARDLYGGSFRWFNDKEKEGRFFFEYTNTEDEMIAAITEDTDIVYIETPTNPLMIEFDIEKVAKIAHDKGAVVID